MQVQIKYYNELLSSRTINNCERLCQLVSDIYGFFLPKKGKLKLTIKTNLKEHAVNIESPKEVCELFNMLWQEWRFEDHEFTD